MARILFTVVCTAFLAQRLVSALTVASSSSKQDENFRVILQQPLTAPGPNVLVTTVEMTIPPGDSGAPPHFHSGPIVIYVIQGELLFQVHGKPIRIIPAGEAFYELDRDIHVWGGNASNSTVCKITATVYGRPEEDFITFVEGYKRESRENVIAAVKRGLYTLTLNVTNDALKK